MDGEILARALAVDPVSAHGIPLLVIPVGSDQPWHADDVQRSGS